MAINLSCTWTGIVVILFGSIGNWLSICVFRRKRFRSSILTPFFIALLIADCFYLTFRVIKLFYYQQTLFDQFVHFSSCETSFFVRIYGYITQHAPQLFIPFCHYDFYIRFALLLMSFLAIQRAYDMRHSTYRIILRKTPNRSLAYTLIICALILSYLFEFFGLSIFCSSELSPNTAEQWYNYLEKNLSNETSSFLTLVKNQSNGPHELTCILNAENNCSRSDRLKIIRHYFDMHDRSIVYLIHRIQISSVGQRMARNELRLKYHYHTCPIRMQADFFLRIYDLLYSRILGLNRYTFILVFGSIIPSIVTISANAFSLRYIITIRTSVTEQSSATRRRTDETRRVIIIITAECLLAIINSWFVDIILSIKYCQWSVAIGDDCPHFLRRYQTLLVLFDLFNSMSNILLYCFAGRRFRYELKRMLIHWYRGMKKCIPCYCQIEWRKTKHLPEHYHRVGYTVQSESSSKPTKIIPHISQPKYEHIKLRVVTFPTTVL